MSLTIWKKRKAIATNISFNYNPSVNLTVDGAVKNSPNNKRHKRRYAVKCADYLCTLPEPSPPASFSTSETDTRL